jgi:hypothetical protein
LHRSVDIKTWAAKERILLDKYSLLQESYGRDHLDSEDGNATVLDPLRAADDDWCTVITVDVKRTFPEIQYFGEREVLQGLARILHYYGREHAQLGYRQGMHELAGVLFYVVRADSNISVESSRTAKDTAEAHTYALFCALMDRIKDLYLTGEKSGIITRAQRVQSSIIKKSDPDLAALLERNEVEPQLWAITWFRLLFSRVFPLTSIIRFWDYIFAADVDSSLGIIDYIAAVLLIRIRQALFAEEQHDRVLSLIFGYSKTIDGGAESQYLDILTLQQLPGAQGKQLFDIIENALYLREHLDYGGGHRIAEHYKDEAVGHTATHKRGSSLAIPTSLLDAARSVTQRLDGVSQGLDIEGTMRSIVDRARSPKRHLQSPSKSPTPSGRQTENYDNARDVALGELLDDSLTILEHELFGNASVEVRRAIDILRHVRECLVDPTLPVHDKKVDRAGTVANPIGGHSSSGGDAEDSNMFHTPARKSLAQSDFSWMVSSPKSTKSGYKGKRQEKPSIDIFELA